jgi:hypothetical protein
MLTESAQEALSILRDGGVYIYTVEVEKRNWNMVFAGLAFWGMDWFNEIWNSLFFHFSGRAPVWGAPGDTAYLILIGLNIEITFMFAIAGIAFSKMLLPDKSTKILGIPNRWFIAITGAAFCVIVEVLLNAVGALTWDWPWWNTRAPWLIFLFGYLYFFLVSFWVHDMDSIKKKAITIGVIYGVDILAILIFGVGLKWL